MAFPYILETSFDDGATGFDTAVTDTQAKISYPHYTTMVKTYGVAPYRGAYSMMLDQSIGVVGTAANQVQAAMNVAASGPWGIGFALYVKSDIVMANTNRFTICSLDSAGPVSETVVDLVYTTAAGLQIHLNELQATAIGALPIQPISMNEWHWIDLSGVYDSGAGDGVSSLYVDNVLVGTLTALTQADGAIDFKLGVIGADAGTTAGHIFFDSVVADEARVPYVERYTANRHVTANEHIFVGPGTIKGARLLTTTAGDLLRLFDCDTGMTTTGGALLKSSSVEITAMNPTLDYEVPFYRGCYAQIAGTNPRAQVSVDFSPPAGYPKSIWGVTEEGVKRYALLRRPVWPGI